MIAFVKRRWILLSCAGVLMACSIIDCTIAIRHGSRARTIGILEGFLSFEVVWPYDQCKPVPASFHRMMLGGALPQYHDAGAANAGNWQVKGFFLPVWLPLAAILGWIVIRELRWREKRAKAAESQPSP